MSCTWVLSIDIYVISVSKVLSAFESTLNRRIMLPVDVRRMHSTAVSPFLTPFGFHWKYSGKGTYSEESERVSLCAICSLFGTDFQSFRRMTDDWAHVQ